MSETPLPRLGDGHILLSQPTPVPTDALEQFRIKALDLIRAHGQGETFEYAISIAPQPGENGPIPAVVLVLAIKSRVVGEMIHATAIVETPWTFGQVEEAVPQMIGALLNARAQQVNGQPPG